MKKSHMFGAVCAVVISLFMQAAIANTITYQVTGTMYLNIGSYDSLSMEGGTYQMSFDINTEAAPDYTYTEPDGHTNVGAPYTYADYETLGQATIHVTGRPNGAEDLIFIRTVYQVAALNYFNWDNTPPSSDQLWIGLATVPPPTGFYELHSGSEIYLDLRNDFWSNEQQPAPIYFPEFGTLPVAFNPNDILANAGSVFQGRTIPSDPFASYGLTNFEITPSTVPIPTAAWLFGSGLLGLVGVARRKTA